MIAGLLARILGTNNARQLKALQPIVQEINSLESTLVGLTDEQLAAKTNEFRQQLSNGKSLDALLPEAYAVVREMAKRKLGQRHFDVQLIGGIVMHQGKIAEMKTGEGKTLTATLPLYLNALEGKGVHLVTVNDYLARRDSEWMGAVFKALGLSVSCLQNHMSDHERKQVYQADIVYATNNELGFDYLRDNMKFRLEDYVQRDLHFAIVDEIDSILIDEARTPLIISGSADKSSKLYVHADRVMQRLQKGVDFDVDEKARSVQLTESGNDKVEAAFNIENLYAIEHLTLLHHCMQALKAHALFRRDVDYVVKDKQVLIVDEFTGRILPGRRYSDGLHQALEAKEHVEIERESQTLASITLQNYFRLYKKLAGMTGTAMTEAEEFYKIYKLNVVAVPTNKAMIRKDEPDLIFLSKNAKYAAIVEDVKERYRKGQPILIGTIAIETSELLSNILKAQGVPHEVLNAKQHQREAEIVEFAGKQAELFERVLDELERSAIVIPLKHAANSAATLHHGTTRHNFVRIGAAAYGLLPTTDHYQQTPIATWKTIVAFIKTVDAGTCVGYDLTYTTTEQTKIALVPVGYYHGYRRALSNKSLVLIKNKLTQSYEYAPVIGRVCMNQMLINVTHLPIIAIGDEVILMGPYDNVRPYDLALLAESYNPREITTTINEIVKRIIITGDSS